MARSPSVQRLGELLVQRGLIRALQLDEALAEQRSTKEFLGAILVRKGLLQPEELLAVLSEQFKIPHEPLPLDRVDWQVAKQFPASVLSAGKCFPIRADGESVTVAIANPLDAWALSAIEKAAGFRKVIPVLVMERELDRALQSYREQSLRTIENLLKKNGDPPPQ